MLWSTVLMAAMQLWSAFNSDVCVQTSTPGPLTRVCWCVLFTRKNYMRIFQLAYMPAVGALVCVQYLQMVYIYIARCVLCVVWLPHVFKENFFYSAGLEVGEWGCALCVCVFQGRVAGHGSMSERKGVYREMLEEKRRCLVAVILCILGLGSGVCICVYIRGIWQFSPSRIMQLQRSKVKFHLSYGGVLFRLGTMETLAQFISSALKCQSYTQLLDLAQPPHCFDLSILCD